MTISTTSNKATWLGNGATSVFSFSFEIGSTTQASLYLTSGGVTTLIPSSSYSISGLGAPSGGTITYPLSGSPIVLGTTLTLIRTVPLQQLVDLVNQSNYFPDAVEGALDYEMMAIQQIAQGLSYALQAPVSDPSNINLTFPSASARADMLAGFDINGNVTTFPITASVGAGNLTVELGSAGSPGFKAGVDFTAGATTSLTLSKAYGNVANVFVAFDGTYQARGTYSIGGVGGTTLTFNGPIPVGVQNVDVVGGTTLSLYVPPNGTVGDAQLQWGTILTRVVTNIAALEALPVSPYQRVLATGYYASGDGGGGEYWYDSTANPASADGGSLIAAAGGVGGWRLVLRGKPSLKQWGAKGDGATDDTVATQAAITFCQNAGLTLYVPTPGVSYMTTAALNVSTKVAIEGDGVQPYTALSSSVANTMGGGSWFYFNHTGKGFNIIGAGTMSGVRFSKIGTYRNQPTPNGANTYTPTVCDWDFYISNADVFMDDICLLNPYQGIYVTNGNQGRLTANNIIGQPLFKGIWIDTSYDSCRIRNVHFWPYWSESLGVNTYTLTNGIAFGSARSDTAMYENLFCYGYNEGFLITQNANGTTTCQITNLNIDDCFNGFVIDNSVSGARVNISNMTCQGASTNISGIGGGVNAGVSCFGTSCNLSIKGIDFGFFGANACNIGGSGNILKVSQDRVYTWNNLNAGYTAYNIQAGNTLIRESLPGFSGGNGAAILGGAGLMKSKLDWGVVSTTTDSQGRVTVSHNGQIAPTGYQFQILTDSGPVDFGVTSSSSTAFTCRLFTPSTGAPLANTAVSFSWEIRF